MACVNFFSISDTLPSRPTRLDAENITDTSILLRWSLDENTITPIEFFIINMTLISDLKHPDESKDALKAPNQVTRFFIILSTSIK